MPGTQELAGRFVVLTGFRRDRSFGASADRCLASRIAPPMAIDAAPGSRPIDENRG